MKNQSVLQWLLIALSVFFSTNALAQLQSDESDAVWSIVMPIAGSKDVDMKECLVGTGKDSVVAGFVENTGSYLFRVDSIYFRGADAASFDLVSGFPKYEVPAGGNHACEFRFTPARVGNHSAEIVIITQADTLVQTITGVGVQPQLSVVGDIIDFGVVNVGNQRDTIAAATIANIGSSPLNIIETRHNKPNDVDFTTLAGGGAFSLSPGDTCKMDLRFEPSDEGRTSGVLEFHYNGVGSPAVVQLFGEGLKNNPQILANADAFPDLVCLSSISDTIRLSNPGGSDLIVDELNLLGADAGDYSISSATPITIEPDSSKDIIVLFNPVSPGNKNAELLVESNADPDSVLTIALFGRKDSVSIVPRIDSLDLGILCPNEPKDTSFIVENAGTILSGGRAMTSTNLSSSNGAFMLNVAETREITIQFPGLPDEGYFEETVTIIDSICGYEREVVVFGEIAAPSISAESIEITAFLGESSEEKIVVTNDSERDITLTAADLPAGVFKIVRPTPPIEIPASESCEIIIRYTPDDEFDDVATLNLAGEPCGITESVDILGAPVNAYAKLQVESFAGEPGQEVNCYIKLIEEKNLVESGVENFEVELSYNSTLLWPLDFEPIPIEGSGSKIRLTNVSSIASPDQVVETIKFRVGLGDAESCAMALSNAKAIGGAADVFLVNGEFTLLGVCREGGTRLLNTSGKAGIVNIYPNPAIDKTSIEFKTIEEGFVNLSLFDIFGNKLDIFKESGLNLGEIYSFEVELHELSSGKYYVQFSTPTYREVKEVSIIK